MKNKRILKKTIIISGVAWAIFIALLYLYIEIDNKMRLGLSGTGLYEQIMNFLKEVLR